MTSPCPTCGCTLYTERGECEGAGLLRSALTALEVLSNIAEDDAGLRMMMPGLPGLEASIRKALDVKT